MSDECHIDRGFMKRFFLFLTFFLACSISAISPEEFNPAADPDLKEAYESAAGLQKIFRAIYKYSRPGVVQVYSESAGNPENSRMNGYQNPASESPPFGSPSLGSGFVIDKEGYIVTNRHVIGSANEVQVKLHDGRTFTAIVIGSDQLTDIALIRVKDAGTMRALEFGDSSAMQVGDWAIAVGSPFGLDGTFTTGVISAVARPGLDNNGLTFLQTDASINQGNSGGPLLNLDGKVIGVNKMIFSPSGGSIGLGFAIPINDIDYVLESLRKNGSVKRAYLGAHILELPPKFAEMMKGRGVYVAHVRPGTAAAKAGLEAGDIILRMNSETITSTRQFIGKIVRLPPGTKITIEIVRGTKTIKLPAVLGLRPDSF